MLEIKKAIACSSWDVCLNGRRIKRFDRKYQATTYYNTCKDILDKGKAIASLPSRSEVKYPNRGKEVSRASLSHWMG
jgi:hypothetical protein